MNINPIVSDDDITVAITINIARIASLGTGSICSGIWIPIIGFAYTRIRAVINIAIYNDITSRLLRYGN